MATEGLWQDVMKAKYISPLKIDEWIKAPNKSGNGGYISWRPAIEAYKFIGDSLSWLIENGWWFGWYRPLNQWSKCPKVITRHYQPQTERWNLFSKYSVAAIYEGTQQNCMQTFKAGLWKEFWIFTRKMSLTEKKNIPFEIDFWPTNRRSIFLRILDAWSRR